MWFRNSHMAMNTFFVILCVLYLCSKATIITGVCRDPPPPPVIFFKTAKPAPGHSYPWRKIRHELRKDPHTLETVKKFRKAARAEKWMQKKKTERPSFIGSVMPNFVNGKLSETCPTRTVTLTLQPRVWYRNDWCWLLRPWWGIRWSFAACKTKQCQGINPQPEIPVTPKFFCRPERYIVHRFVLFCKHLHPRIQIRHLRLPQCCDSFKWQCFVKGK